MDLQQWLNSLGFNFVPVLDGKRHRCDENGSRKSDHIWYIGSSEMFLGGKTRTTLTIGNWRTDEQWYYSSGKPSDYSWEERAYYAKKQREATEKAEREKREEQERAALEAQKLWNEWQPVSEGHPYLTKKKISVEISSLVRQSGDCLLIPMRDIDGKLWGIQRIWPDGTKRFLPGSRKNGLYFNFPGSDDPIVAICEGFATGASVSQATGMEVFVAFDAGHLKTCALDIRKAFPDRRIIICGDDDRWGSSGRNVGREKATEAARECGGVAAFPEFDYDEGWVRATGMAQPTDWNDLHCLEGLDEVRRQIEGSINQRDNGASDKQEDDTGRNGSVPAGEGLLEINPQRPELETAEESIDSAVQSEENEFPIDALGPLLSNVTKIIYEKKGQISVAVDDWKKTIPSSGNASSDNKGGGGDNSQSGTEGGSGGDRGRPEETNGDGQQSETAEPKIEIRCLGHSGSDYFYTTGSNKQIITLARSAHSSTNLLDLQPLKYWSGKYGKQTKSGWKIGWDKAASDLMEECRKNGIFKPEKVRGIGCWIDNKKLIIHVGDKLIVDKKEVKIGEFDSRYIYELGRSIPVPSSKPITNEECLKIIDAVSSLNWKNKDDAVYFLGWMAISRLCGALKWRPHVWLTGPSGSGKTTLLDKVAKKLSSDWVVIPVSNSTEAGIRQNICKDALPVIFDEAETSDRKSGAKIQNILSLIRQASSNTDAKIMKGTSDQGGMQFTINSMFLLSSIRVNLIEEQDVNRFTVCELLRNNPEDWPILQNKIDMIKDDWGDRMLSRMIECFPAYLDNVESVSEEIAKIHSQRAADQYAPLVAGYLSLLTVGKISKEKIKEVVCGLEISNKSAIEEEHDELECLNHLLGCKIRITNADGEARDDILSKLIDLAFQEVPVDVHHYRNYLQVYGLKVSSCGTVLHVANRNSELGKIFNDTKWHSMWKNSLIRINGARKGRSRFGSINPLQCVDIPRSSIIIG